MRFCGLNDAVGDISFTLLFHSVALTEPGEEHGEVAQVGLEQFLSWKHGFAELSGEKKLNVFVSIKPLQIMECNLKGNYMSY